jgi:hypothetical protein
MSYQPSPACIAAVTAAANGQLNAKEIQATFERVDELKQRLIREGTLDDLPNRLRKAVEEEAERTKIAAAMQKRQAALNVIIADKINTVVDRHIANGLDPRRAMLALMEGTQQGVKGGRFSVATQKLAYRRRFVWDLMAEVQKEAPHLVDIMATDKTLNEDVAREMYELRDGGTPGSTKNKDAQKLAAIFAKHVEYSREKLNSLGASIGKLDGWAGAQVHDNLKMMAAGRDAWTRAILPRLDLERTFPDASSAAEMDHILGEMYKTLVTGVDPKAISPSGGRVNPPNLAKSLGKSRILHFKTVDDALAYQKDFGFGMTIPSLFAHQLRASKLAGQMDIFGPNPENMIRQTLDRMQRQIRDNPAIGDKQKREWADNLEFDKFTGAYNEMSGLTSSPVHHKAAQIMANIRAHQQWVKLGGAVITAMPTDTLTAGAASMFRGGGFWAGLGKQIAGLMEGRAKGEGKEIAFLLGEGYDGLIGHMLLGAQADALDAPAGWAAKASEKFFKWNGLTGWTERSREVGARLVSAEMGLRTKTAWANLPPKYRHVLDLNGLTEGKWQAIQQGSFRAINGSDYVTPDAMRALPDAAVTHLVTDKIAQSQRDLQAKIDSGKVTVADHAAHDERVAQLHNDAREELEMDLARFVADETNYGTLETDAQSRRIVLRGTRPGTVAGEVLRLIGQFKGFPVAFASRILGRALYGGEGATRGARLAGNLPHIGALLAGLTVAGYASVVAKSLLRGQTPPVPTNAGQAANIFGQSFVQGGAAGIYGDFLFGTASGYGNTALETAAGPVAGNISSALNLYYAFKGKLSDEMAGKTGGHGPLGQALNLAINNFPGANLWYARAAADMLFLNSLREAASPGYLRRNAQQLLQNRNQSYYLPRTAF